MELKNNLDLLEHCRKKYNKKFNDHNFQMITHNNEKVIFNFRQSRFPTLLGISRSYLDNYKDNDGNLSDFMAFLDLIDERDDYFNHYLYGKVNENYIFNDDASERINNFLDLYDIDDGNVKFFVKCNDSDKYDGYLFVNNSYDYNGFFIAFEKSDLYYIPRNVIRVSNEEEFKNILSNGSIGIIMHTSIKNKKDNTFTNFNRRIGDFRLVSSMLSEYGVDGFEFTDNEVMDIQYDTQPFITRWAASNEFGHPEFGKIKVNRHGLDFLKWQRDEIIRLQKELDDAYKEAKLIREKLGLPIDASLDSVISAIDTLYSADNLEKSDSLEKSKNETLGEKVRKLVRRKNG